MCLSQIYRGDVLARSWPRSIILAHNTSVVLATVPGLKRSLHISRLQMMQAARRWNGNLSVVLQLGTAWENIVIVFLCLKQTCEQQEKFFMRKLFAFFIGGGK